MLTIPSTAIIAAVVAVVAVTIAAVVAAAVTWLRNGLALGVLTLPISVVVASLTVVVYGARTGNTAITNGGDLALLLVASVIGTALLWPVGLMARERARQPEPPHQPKSAQQASGSNSWVYPQETMWMPDAGVEPRIIGEAAANE